MPARKGKTIRPFRPYNSTRQHEREPLRLREAEPVRAVCIATGEFEGESPEVIRNDVPGQRRSRWPPAPNKVRADHNRSEYPNRLDGLDRKELHAD